MSAWRGLIFPAVGFTWHGETVAHVIGVLVPVVTSYLGHKHFSFAAPRRLRRVATMPSKRQRHAEPEQQARAVLEREDDRVVVELHSIA